MNLEILTPEQTIYKGDASLVQLPGIDGLFEILNNHAPLISVLSKGKVKIKVDDDFKYFDINGGVVEVKNNKTLVLAE
ncbi:MAG: ATP synthase F1 subunit epsilon [Bacteroidales bacterium]|nr:ATP synthase F1 subunit epsilon [Bacteroidales bacterium]MCF8337851.1 ATP synthase F1 subunit epsilon [Bacteroidales bacterium]